MAKPISVLSFSGIFLSLTSKIPTFYSSNMKASSNSALAWGSPWTWLLVISMVMSVSIAAPAAEKPVSIAVHLGPEYITAANFSRDEDPSAIASIQGDESYQNYLANCREFETKRFMSLGRPYFRDEEGQVEPPLAEQDNRYEAGHIFNKALADIKIAAESAMDGRPVEIKAIARPLYLNDTSDEGLVMAFENQEPSFRKYDQPYRQIITNVDAAWRGYRLYEREGILGLASGAEVGHDLVYVEFNKGYLEVSIIYFDGDARTIEFSKRWDDLGSHIFDGWISSVDMWRLRYALLEVATHRRMESARTEWWRPTAHMAFGGDAAPEHMEELEKSIWKHVPLVYGGMHKEISPFDLGAVGAGFQVKHYETFRGFVDNIPVFPLLENGTAIAGHLES